MLAIFSYKGSDGTSRSEQGQQKQIGDAAGTAITGVIEFTSPEGQKFTLRYIGKYFCHLISLF